MARTSERNKHPGLALKQTPVLTPKVLPPGKKDEPIPYKDLPGWEKLSLEQRKFLAAYAWMGEDMKRACELAEVDVLSVENWKREDATFAFLYRRVFGESRDLALMLLNSMMAWSIMELKGLIEQNEDKRAKFQAIKHYHQMMGMVRPEGAMPASQFVSVDVNLGFGGDK